MTAQPTDGLHVLRNAWTQRSRIGEHCRTLASGLEDAIRATRLAAPRRPGRGKDFCIDSASHVGRKGLEAIDPKSQERRIERLLYEAYGPAGPLRRTDLWERLVAFQVPLFAERRRNDWGHIDLLALGSHGGAIVIELKKASGARGRRPRNPTRHAPPAGTRQGFLHRPCVPFRAEGSRGDRSEERGAKDRAASPAPPAGTRPGARIDPASHFGRRGLAEIDPNDARALGSLQRDHVDGPTTAGTTPGLRPTGPLGTTDLWERLVAFQMPLFERQQRNDWGHIDHSGAPRGWQPDRRRAEEARFRRDAAPHPDRGAGERNRRGGELANAVEGDPRDVVRAGLRIRTDGPAPVTVRLAPDAYWRSWQADGTAGRSVKSSARDEFRRLRAAVADAGYPVLLATFDWPFDRDPRVRRADVDW